VPDVISLPQMIRPAFFGFALKNAFRSAKCRSTAALQAAKAMADPGTKNRRRLLSLTKLLNFCWNLSSSHENLKGNEGKFQTPVVFRDFRHPLSSTIPGDFRRPSSLHHPQGSGISDTDKLVGRSRDFRHP